jgi:hypothetical protein
MLCISELFNFTIERIVMWLIAFPVGFLVGWYMDKYLGWATCGVIYAIIIITMFATGIIGWC